LVVHFTPYQMASRQEYKNFVEENFTPDTQHIHLSSPLNQFSGYAAAHRIQHQLHQLAPQVFPLLGEQLPCQSQSLSLNLKKTKLNEADVEDNANAKDAEEEEQGVVAMTNFHLRPRKGGYLYFIPFIIQSILKFMFIYYQRSGPHPGV